MGHVRGVQNFHKKVGIRLAVIDKPFTWLCRQVGFRTQAYHILKKQEFPNTRRLVQISNLLGLDVNIFFEDGMSPKLLENYTGLLNRKATSKDRVRVRLRVLGMEVQELSRHANLDLRSMSQWLRSDHAAQDEKLLVVSEALKMPVEVLSNSEDYPLVLLEGWDKAPSE